MVLFSLLLGLRFTETATTDSFTGMLGDDKVPLLALSAVWSLKTVVQANVGAATDGREVGLQGKALLWAYHVVSAAQRFWSLFLYFAPALGFAGVMQSWRFGAVPFVLDSDGRQMIYDVRHDGAAGVVYVRVDEVWQPVSSPSQLTGASLGTFYAVLLAGWILHVCAVALIKLAFAPKFR